MLNNNGYVEVTTSEMLEALLSVPVKELDHLALTISTEVKDLQAARKEGILSTGDVERYNNNYRYRAIAVIGEALECFLGAVDCDTGKDFLTGILTPEVEGVGYGYRKVMPFVVQPSPGGDVIKEHAEVAQRLSAVAQAAQAGLYDWLKVIPHAVIISNTRVSGIALTNLGALNRAVLEGTGVEEKAKEAMEAMEGELRRLESLI
jgi:hypothetical protein